jgi:predicted nucleic acid-binding protein
MPASLYVDTSSVLRAVLESGTSPEMEGQLTDAPLLVTSRLAIVEAARAFLRLRALRQLAEARIADAEREAAGVFARCEIWELTRTVCDLARQVAPLRTLRTLDALHLATFVLARRRIEGLELLTSDERLREAALAL